jgi:microcystin-dependent protein
MTCVLLIQKLELFYLMPQNIGGLGLSTEGLPNLEGAEPCDTA